MVKGIPGRRWDPSLQCWLLPAGSDTLERLKRAYGHRLVVLGEGAVEKGQAGAEAAPSSDHEDEGEREEGGGTDPVSLRGPLRRAIRARGHSPRTEPAYVGRARRLLEFRGRAVSRLQDLDGSDARGFLEHLGEQDRLAAGSRNQAASALAFLFREVLGRDELADVPRAKGPKRMPTVLTHREVLLVLQELTGKHFVVGVSLYSAGLRLEECLRLRVKDVDFELRQVLVRDGKGRKDRYVALAQRAAPLVKAQIERVSGLHKRDRAAGHGWAPLPGALHRKDPSAGHALGSVPLPRDQNSPGSCDRQDRTPSAPPDRGTAAGEEGRSAEQDPEASHLPYVSPLLRHRSPPRRL